MENKHIKELMTAMQRTGTKRLVIKREGIELELEREDNGSSNGTECSDIYMDENPMRQEFYTPKANSMLSRGGDIQTTINNPEAKKPETIASGSFVTSPMVGTLYLTPAPGDPSFVKVGDRVEKDTVVCIIEAMKVMNEVKAGVAGIIAEKLVENGHPVEFATKLFRITPAA